MSARPGDGSRTHTEPRGVGRLLPPIYRRGSTSSGFFRASAPGVCAACGGAFEIKAMVRLDTFGKFLHKGCHLPPAPDRWEKDSAPGGAAGPRF